MGQANYSDCFFEVGVDKDLDRGLQETAITKVKITQPV